MFLGSPVWRQIQCLALQLLVTFQGFGDESQVWWGTSGSKTIQTEGWSIVGCWGIEWQIEADWTIQVSAGTYACSACLPWVQQPCWSPQSKGTISSVKSYGLMIVFCYWYIFYDTRDWCTSSSKACKHHRFIFLTFWDGDDLTSQTTYFLSNCFPTLQSVIFCVAQLMYLLTVCCCNLYATSWWRHSTFWICGDTGLSHIAAYPYS